MKRNHGRVIFPLTVLAMSLPLLSGCNIYDFFGGSGVGGNSSYTTSLAPATSIHTNDFDGYYQQTSDPECDFHSIGAYNETPYLPSKGDVSVMVVPVEFSEYPFSSSTIEDIEKLTAGTAEDTNYWESLSSFYYKSSYGALNLSFIQTDVINVGTVNDFVYNSKASRENYESAASYAMRLAVNDYKKKNGADSTKQFDSDDDGYIDSVIMIYSAPDMQKDASLERFDSLFWAYCYAENGYEVTPNKASPVGFRYFWASYDFFYAGTTNVFGVHSGVDAHTLIHETGHLMGSDDYYNVIDNGTDIKEPSGGLMMMAYNVSDHDMFTKLCYGWVKPYVVTDNCTISIKPSQENGDCILLADSWNGSSFDEYILIDFVTPTGLNELDSKTLYPEYKGTKVTETGFKSPGIRVLHIDNRLVYGVGYPDGITFLDSGVVSDAEIQSFSRYDKTVTYQGSTYYAMVAPGVTNCALYDCSSFQGKGYELIQMIPRSRSTNWTTGNAATSSDLFREGDTFSLSQYKNFFPREITLNNGKALPFSFTVDSLSSDQAVLSFTKLG